MNVRFIPEATEEVEQAGIAYGLSSEQSSDAFFTRLSHATERLRTNARTFPLVKGRRRGREIRILSLDKFPYALIYEVLDGEIAILHLWHEKSRGKDWSRREP